MRKVEVEQIPEEMSAVCQLFAALDVIHGEPGVIVYPTPDEQARLLVMDLAALHYKDVKETIMGGKVVQLNLFQLKEGSKILVENELEKEGLLTDLYRSNQRNIPYTPQKLKYYLINSKEIQEIQSKEIDEVFTVFHATFFAQGQSILLQPTGWRLEDNLKSSYTIRAFSRLAGELVLWVNEDTNEVIGLEVYGCEHFS